MYVTPELPAELEAELMLLFERGTSLLLQRVDENDMRKHSRAEWTPRFKLVRKDEQAQLNMFGPTYKLVDYVEIVFSPDGRLDALLASRLPDKLWNVVIIVVESPRADKKRMFGYRVRAARPPHQTFPNGVHMSEPLTDRKNWSINKATCEMLEALFDRYRPP